MLNSLVPPSSGVRFPALDGLRGFAVLGVMLFHLNHNRPIGNWAGMSLTIFFALSAFLLSYAFFRKRRVDVSEYYRRRFWRIYPAYVVFIMFASLVYPSSAENILSHLVFAHTFTAHHHALIPPAWSLAVEVQFYLLLPVLAGACISKPRITLPVLGGLGMAFCLLPRLVEYQPMHLPHSFLPFVAGMYAAYVAHRPCPRYVPALGILGLSAMLVIPKPPDFEMSSMMRLVIGMRGLLPSASCFLLIWGLVRRSAVFGFAPLRLIGTAGYGIFLFHYPFFVLMRDSPFALYWVAAPLIAVAVGVLSYLLVESPLMRLGQRARLSRFRLFQIPLPSLRFSAPRSTSVPDDNSA